MDMTPAIAIHIAAALGAVVTGPVALWARRSGAARPKLHRAFGYAWVTLMVTTAVSALFIRSGAFPNILGFSPIHLLIPVVLLGLTASFVALARGNIARHRMIMQQLYLGACLVAGFFTLLPGRTLGRFIGIQSMADLLVAVAAAGIGFLAWRALDKRLALQRDPW